MAILKGGKLIKLSEGKKIYEEKLRKIRSINNIQISQGKGQRRQRKYKQGKRKKV